MDTKPTPFTPTFYDLLDMRNRPADIGLAKIVEDSRSWWPTLPDKTIIDLDAVRRFAAKLDHAVPVCIDFEDIYDASTKRVRPLRIDGRIYTAQQVSDDAGAAVKIARAYREGGFTGKLGFYGLLPIREVDWCILKNDPRYPAEQRLWKLANSMAALARGLLDEIDFTAPSLYAIGPSVSQHIEWTEANINQAKSLGKPVIAYISPESHWSATGGFARQILSQPQWTASLETVRRNRVDAALWLGGDNTFKHDFEESPDWWILFNMLTDSWNPAP